MRAIMLVVRAACALIAARLALGLRPGRALAQCARNVASGGSPEEAADLARAVARAARYLPFGATCLERALALRTLLHSAHVHSTLVIGVRRTGDTLDAHAWLEYEGRGLAGVPPAGRYTPMLSR